MRNVTWQSRKESWSVPEGAAALAGLRELVAQSAVVPEERIVLFNTGTGMKYLQ